MNIDKIIELFNQKGEVHFKLYSLEYTIKKENDVILVYPDLYATRKQSFKTIEDALNYFTVYNESLIENENRIINII